VMTRFYLPHVQRGTPGSMSFAQKLAVATDKADAEKKERARQEALRQDAAEAQKIRSWVSGQQNKSSNASDHALTRSVFNLICGFPVLLLSLPFTQCEHRQHRCCDGLVIAVLVWISCGSGQPLRFGACRNLSDLRLMQRLRISRKSVKKPSQPALTVVLSSQVLVASNSESAIKACASVSWNSGSRALAFPATRLRREL